MKTIKENPEHDVDLNSETHALHIILSLLELLACVTETDLFFVFFFVIFFKWSFSVIAFDLDKRPSN